MYAKTQIEEASAAKERQQDKARRKVRPGWILTNNRPRTRTRSGPKRQRSSNRPFLGAQSSPPSYPLSRPCAGAVMAAYRLVSTLRGSC